MVRFESQKFSLHEPNLSYSCHLRVTIGKCGLLLVFRSVVLSHLEHLHYAQSTAIVMIYFTYKEEQEQSLGNLFGSILQQLTSQDPECYRGTFQAPWRVYPEEQVPFSFRMLEMDKFAHPQISPTHRCHRRFRRMF